MGREVLSALARLDRIEALLVLAPTEWPAHWYEGSTALEIHGLQPGVRAKFVGENITLRRLLSRWGADALLSLTDTSLVGCPVPHVLMVQQGFMAYEPGDLNFTLPRRVGLHFRAMAAYLRRGLPSVDRVTVQTAHMKQAFCERWGHRPEEVSVVPSTVPRAIRELGEQGPIAPSDPPSLACISGPGPYKNHAVLAPMMAALSTDIPALRCLLTVRPDEVPELTRRAEGLGVLNRFEFAGRLSMPETMSRLRGAVAAVLPSKLESFGIPYHEAMALGVPVAASDTPHAREALDDAGWYAPADDGLAWADAVRAMLGDRAEAARRSRARFEAHSWTWDEVAAAYVVLLQETIASSSRFK